MPDPRPAPLRPFPFGPPDQTSAQEVAGLRPAQTVIADPPNIAQYQTRFGPIQPPPAPLVAPKVPFPFGFADATSARETATESANLTVVAALILEPPQRPFVFGAQPADTPRPARPPPFPFGFADATSARESAVETASLQVAAMLLEIPPETQFPPIFRPPDTPRPTPLPPFPFGFADFVSAQEAAAETATLAVSAVIPLLPQFETPFPFMAVPPPTPRPTKAPPFPFGITTASVDLAIETAALMVVPPPPPPVVVQAGGGADLVINIGPGQPLVPYRGLEYVPLPRRPKCVLKEVDGEWVEVCPPEPTLEDYGWVVVHTPAEAEAVMATWQFEESTPIMPAWAWILLIVGAVAAGAIVTYLLKRRRVFVPGSASRR